MWYLYVVKCADKSLYCGITKDLGRRLYEHNSTKRGAKYTRSRRPVDLLFSLRCKDRSESAILEARFKRLTPSKKRELLQSKNDLLRYLGRDPGHTSMP